MSREVPSVVRDAALVFVGGALGVLLREVLVLSAPGWSQISVGLLVVNLGGAAALGFVSAVLGAGRDRLRLLVTTGILGGFTSYSAFAWDVTRLVGSVTDAGAADGSSVWPLVGFVLASLLGGVAVAALGGSFGSLLRQRMSSANSRNSRDE